MFDGVPLDGRAEAVIVGVIVPALWWLDRSFFDRIGARWLIVALLALKVGGAFLGQDGLCARFSTAAPLVGTILTMPIDEPRGVLRSWDVRADWRADEPSCTAILDRPYGSAAEFPAWFVNILDQLRPGHRDVRMTIAGAITVPDAGELSFATGEDMRLGGRIDDAVIAIGGGRDVHVRADGWNARRSGIGDRLIGRALALRTDLERIAGLARRALHAGAADRGRARHATRDRHADARHRHRAGRVVGD